MTLDLDQLQQDYARDGYAVAPGLLTMDEVEALRRETLAVATGERGAILGVDLLEGQGEGVLASILAIHFPHKVSPLMRDAMRHPAIVAILTRLIGPDVKAMQSMLFVKNAGKPGQAWHQDEHYIPTRDRSLCGAWIALDDAAIDNGGMWMQPGSHTPGILWPTRPHSDPRFDNAEESYGWPYKRESGVPVEIAAGGVAFFNGYTLHRSLENRRKSGFRRALVFHYMNARSLLPWAFGLPPQPRQDFRDVEIVAGQDPYAWKGKEDVTFAFIRPEDPEIAKRLFSGGN